MHQTTRIWMMQFSVKCKVDGAHFNPLNKVSNIAAQATIVYAGDNIELHKSSTNKRMYYFPYNKHPLKKIQQWLPDKDIDSRAFHDQERRKNQLYISV